MNIPEMWTMLVKMANLEKIPQLKIFYTGIMLIINLVNMNVFETLGIHF